MGFFSRKKVDDISQHIQNLEIRQAATQGNNFSSPQANSQNNFVNPFLQENQNEEISLNEPKNFNQIDTNNSSFNFNQPNISTGQQMQIPNQVQLNQNSFNPVVTPNLNNNPPLPTFNGNNVQYNNNNNFNYKPLPIQPIEEPQINNKQNDELSSLISSQNKVITLTRDEVQEMIDETIEKLLEEKWESLVENVGKIANWKEKQENDVKQLKEDLEIIKENFEKIEKKFNTKLTDYDKNIIDVNTEIKALEKVFQKITPTLVNNVNELSKIANDLKGVKSSKDENSQQNSPNYRQ